MRAVSNDHLKASSSAVASNNDELFDRTVWLVTEHHQYYFFVRNLAYMQLLGRELSANETEAMELWTLMETLEAEDVILRLRASPPKPELVAMILLMGRSIFAAQRASSVAGKAKAAKFVATKAFIQSCWILSAAKTTKSAFASKVVFRIAKENDARRLRGEPLLVVPSAETARKYLTGIKKAAQR